MMGGDDPVVGARGAGRTRTGPNTAHRVAAGRSAYLAGLAAEDIALRLYQGSRLMATRWRCPEGEIDLILASPGQLVFVEVKARRSLALAAWSLTRRQQARIGAAAARYLAEIGGSDVDARFDVVLVDGYGRAERVENAFGYEGA